MSRERRAESSKLAAHSLKNNQMKKHCLLPAIILLSAFISNAQLKYRSVVNFDPGWKFYYADTTDTKDDYKNAAYNDNAWRQLNLPHDWSIEGNFDKNNPARPEG